MNDSSDEEDVPPPEDIVLPRSMVDGDAADKSLSYDMKKVLANEKKKTVGVRSLVSKKKRRCGAAFALCVFRCSRG